MSTMESLQEEMSHIPLSELKALQDKIGLKAFNKIKQGMASKKPTTETVFKRENKNRPREVSARRPVPSTSQVPKEKVTRDPRYDDLSGEFNERIFKHTYGFLTDVKTKEKLKLKKMMKKAKNPEKRAELKQLYNRIEQRELAEKRKEKEQELEREWKKKEREAVKTGKTPYFLKKSEKRALVDAEFAKEREKSGTTQKYLARKRKKLVHKEKKKEAWTTEDV